MKPRNSVRVLTEVACTINGSADAADAQASVGAVVVLYHPDPSLLARLIRSIVPQVQKIFIVDNTPGNNSALSSAAELCGKRVFYHANGANAGLASAQNIGIDRAIREGFTHVLLLDQDSALPAGALDGLLSAERSLLQSGVQVASVGPLYIDEKTGDRSRSVRHTWLRVHWFPIAATECKPVETDYLIASGSLIRTSVLMHVGLMRGELFIDWVDTEWAYRARSVGYCSYIVPSVVMRHSIGDRSCCFLGRQIYLHSPVRNYYIVRNAAYLTRDRRMSLRWRITMVTYIPKYILVHAWLSQNRWSSLLHMLRAIWEGATGRMRSFPTP